MLASQITKGKTVFYNLVVLKMVFTEFVKIIGSRFHLNFSIAASCFSHLSSCLWCKVSHLIGLFFSILPLWPCVCIKLICYPDEIKWEGDGQEYICNLHNSKALLPVFQSEGIYLKVLYEPDNISATTV